MAPLPTCGSGSGAALAFPAGEVMPKSNRVDLRNALAHGQDILLGLWPEIIDIVEKAERILDQCERDLRNGDRDAETNGGA